VKERDYLEDLGVEIRIILKLVFNIKDVTADWIVLIDCRDK